MHRKDDIINMLKEIWNEYFLEECSVIDTEEERNIIKEAARLHDIANELLTNEQKDAVEKYVDALYETQNFFTRKAFFKGCEFAASFFLETGLLDNK